MSALGQKRTFHQFRPMSALPPKADIPVRNYNVRFVPKADILRCGKNALFDHLVSNAEQSWRNDEPEHPSGRTVDNQLKFTRLHHR